MLAAAVFKTACRRPLIFALMALAALPCCLSAQEGRAPVPPLPFLTTAAIAFHPQQAGNPAADQPLLLLVPPHSGPAPARRDDPALALTETLRETLRASQKYEVLLYSPTQPLIRRALLEHAVSAADLTEPLQPQPLQRLAEAIGARYILTVQPVRSREGLKTDVQLQEETGQQMWRTPLMGSFTADAMSGKKRLTTHDLIAITVDDITERMGIPSHLAAGLRPVSHGNRAEGKKERNGKSAQTGAAPPSDKKKAAAGSHGAQTVDRTGPAPARPARSNNKTQDAPPKTPPLRSQEFTTDASPGSPTVPSPTAPSARTDYEAEAARYRQTGDLANAILSLRHAINDQPKDLGLRRQLIQAYLDRQMPDAALSEAARARALAPNDSALCVLSGNALLAKGDVDGATKAFQEAVKLDPEDTAAQVALGDTQLADSQFDAAVHAYESAARRDPHSPLPHRRLARALAARAAADPDQYAASL
ncbi:MAG TPA: tetratricopeptide repeat protein, partial [Chthonomonadaceae bacterium]|nr:tetratricopeptide repeat protein [Chthonomonadaceae bacterium]